MLLSHEIKVLRVAGGQEVRLSTVTSGRTGIGIAGMVAGTRNVNVWDTLHPGHDWTWRDPNMGDAQLRDQILADLGDHFSTGTIYRDLDQVLKGFIDELRLL